MNKKIALSISALFVPFFAVEAAVTVNLTALALLNDINGDPLPADRPLFLVADTSGTGLAADGFASVLAGTYGIGDAIDGGNDRIVSIFDLTSGAAAFSSPGAAEHTLTFDESLFGGTGISLAVYWFGDTVHAGTDRGDSVGSSIEVTLLPSASGNRYDPNGTRIDAGFVDGSDPWLIPAAGGTVGLSFLTENTGGGTQPNELGNSMANFVIPEPSSVLSVILGSLLLSRRRR